jgi:hypothetical protein
MNEIMNDNRFYHIALPLGIHLTAYFTNIKDGNIKDYRALWLKIPMKNTFTITGFYYEEGIKFSST